MSLINQMLKELDARRAEVGGGPFGEQVRAVPPRRGIHPAWWVALALAIALVGLVTWVLLRPATDPYMVQARLPLKLEVDLDLDTGNSAAQLPPLASPAQTASPIDQGGLAGESQDSAQAETVSPDMPLPAVTLASEPVPGPASESEQASRSAPAPRSTVMVATPAKPPMSGKVAAAPARARDDAAASDVHDERNDQSPAQAVAVNKQVRELTPQQRSENEFRKATLAMQQGRRADALAGFEQALKLDARHAGARQAMIAALLDAKRSEEALLHAREGLALDGRQVGLAMILARLQLESDDLQGALATLKNIGPHAAGRPDYQAFYAALLQRDGQHKAAVDQYMQAVSNVPQNGLWWMGLGISLQAERRNAEAQEAFKRAKGTNSLSPELAAFVDSRLAQFR